MKTMVVIPHFGSDALLERCLEGVYANKDMDSDSVIVVDNNKQNRMFTVGINVGIVEALERGAEYVWVLNNDTIPDRDYLTNSLDRFRKSRRCGMVGGKNLRMDDPDRIFWGGSGRSFPSGRHKMGRVSNNDLNKATIEPWCTFSSVIIDARMFSLVGLPDEQFLMICSDSDYCFRIRLAGYQVWYEPRSNVLHHLGASNKGASSHSPEMLAILRRDQKRFFDKWSWVTGCTDREALDGAINEYIALSPSGAAP